MASDSSSSLSDALGALAPALVSCAERDPAFRKALLELAVQVQRTLGREAAPAGAAAVTNNSAESPAPGSPAPGAAASAAAERKSDKEAASKGGSKSTGSDEDRRRIRSAKEFRADISLVPRRSALKAKGCDLAVRLLDEGETAELLHAIEEARAQAKKITDCQLWMLDPRAPEMTPADLRQCAECYTNLSRAVDLADRDEQRRGLDEAPSKRLMLTVAEAQSAVYATLSARGLRGDRDQLQTFGWLRERTDYYRVFIPRFMDRNRLADPAEWQDLRNRLERLERAHEEPTLAAEAS
ncbi:MAG: hypothetical protein ACYS26_13145 [Planctomycetota bacterium]|jgi:hypothetical protein